MRGGWAQHRRVAERPDVVDLLLDERARELLVDRQAVAAGAVLSGGVPERRVEDDHRSGRAERRDAAASSVAHLGALAR